MDDGDESELEKEEQELFCKFLPLEERDQLGEKVEGGDEQIRASKAEIDLYQCTDREGEIKVITNSKESILPKYSDNSCKVWEPLQG